VVYAEGYGDTSRCEIPAISKHLKNIYEQGELVEERTASKMEIVRMEGNMSRFARNHTNLFKSHKSLL